MTLPAHKFAGVHSALVTPFNRHGDIDFGALSELIALQRMDGINGVLMAGSTGEAPTLTMTDREHLIKAAKDNAGALVVIAGAGSNSTKQAIELQKAMEGAGADATLSVVPYYNKPTQRGLYEHFSAIAKEAKIPVIIYNATGRTGIDIAPLTVAEIAKEHDSIIGIKDVNGNMERLTNLMFLTKKVRSDFLVLCGEDSHFLPYLALGADGIISVLSQVAASEMLTIYRSVKNGDLAYAQKIAQKLNGLCALFTSYPNPIPIKTALSALGLVEKLWRLPLCPLLPHEEDEFLDRCRGFAFIKNFKARGFAQ